MTKGLNTRFYKFQIASGRRGSPSPPRRMATPPHRNPYACFSGLIDEEENIDAFAELPFKGKPPGMIPRILKWEIPAAFHLRLAGYRQQVYAILGDIRDSLMQMEEADGGVPV